MRRFYVSYYYDSCPYVQITFVRANTIEEAREIVEKYERYVRIELIEEDKQP